jgi:hypothetical protein
VDQRKRFQSAMNTSQQNLHATTKSDNGKANNVDFSISKTLSKGSENIPGFEKLSKISAKHRDQLREHFLEFERNSKSNYTRIFPASGTIGYDVYFEQPRSANKLLYKYMY